MGLPYYFGDIKTLYFKVGIQFMVSVLGLAEMDVADLYQCVGK